MLGVKTCMYILSIYKSINEKWTLQFCAVVGHYFTRNTALQTVWRE